MASLATGVLDLAEDEAVAAAELVAHPPVDDGVVGAGGHGQPVGRHPHVAHGRVLPDVRVGVAQDGDEVDGQPAHAIDPHHRHHHLDDLQHTGRGRGRCQSRVSLPLSLTHPSLSLPPPPLSLSLSPLPTPSISLSASLSLFPSPSPPHPLSLPPSLPLCSVSLLGFLLVCSSCLFVLFCFCWFFSLALFFFFF